jgi:CheY-like chemotaxis protein
VAQIFGHLEHVRLLTAHTAELGIGLALSRCPDLILLDINLSGMDGYQALKLIRNEETLKSVSVIAVTANAMQGDIARGKAAGFAEYVTKPINVEGFVGMIRRFLPI